MTKKRVGIVGLYNESNTFCKKRTEWSDFEDGHLFLGKQILEEYTNAFHEIGGFIEAIADINIELIPIFFAEATPGGIIEHSCYEGLKYRLIHELETVMPLDAVYVVAHGAAVSEVERDMDGDWLSVVRSCVGDDVYIVGSLDPHANVSQKMIEATDALQAYRTNPHLDQRETGVRVATLLRKMLFENLRIKQELIQFSASMSIEQQETNVEPCVSLYRELNNLVALNKGYDMSFILGFPYADVDEMGSSIVLLSEYDEDTTVLKSKLKACVESYYDDFVGDKVTIEDVLIGNWQKPLLVLDMGDNVGGGAMGNSSYILDIFEERGIQHAYCCIYAPELVSKIDKVPIGTELIISFSKYNSLNAKVEYKVKVMDLQDGKFVETAPRHGGQVHYDMGKVALVKTENSNWILLTSLRTPPFSSKQLEVCTLPIEELDWIVAKGVNAPIGAFKSICPDHVKVHTPGECNADATQFRYEFRRKPMIPFEKIFN